MNENNRSLRSTKLMRISSLDRNDKKTDNQYDFSVSFNDSDLSQVKRVVLKSVIIPNTSYNINTTNNTIFYDSSSLTLPVGQYTLSTLITAIENAFSAINVLTITQDALTQKLTFTFTSNIVLQSTSTMKYVIGFNDTMTSNTVHVMPNLPDLTGLKKVFIKSSALSNMTSMSDSSKKHYNIFSEVDITVPFGFVEHRVLSDLHSSDELTFSQPKNISTIDIKLYDQHLNNLDLNGHHIELIFKIFF